MLKMRPYTTLFLLMSLDGKISTGASDSLDSETDWTRIAGVSEGFHQYYEAEQKTDLWSMNTGLVMQKIGINSRSEVPPKSPVSFVIIDNKPHLNNNGLEYLSAWLNKVIIFTTNNSHPAFDLAKQKNNIEVILHEDHINFSNLFQALKSDHGIERITIQSGGTLNASLIRQGLIDEVNIIVAPLLVGGKETPTLVDGISLISAEEISNLKALELISCTPLDHSYINLRYKVINNTRVSIKPDMK